LFCGYEFAWVANVRRRSLSARIVIADNAIAAWNAANEPGTISDAVRIAGISRVRKDGSITVTGNGNTDSVERRRA
jgi:hypothetical protein